MEGEFVERGLKIQKSIDDLFGIYDSSVNYKWNEMPDYVVSAREDRILKDNNPK